MFADVILPLPLASSFTYAIPSEMHGIIDIGFRVEVPFGKSKHYTAIVQKIHNNRPEGVDVKEIHSLLDSHPIVNQNQLYLWEWISFYYICSLGEVYKAALPASLKPTDLNDSYNKKSINCIQFHPDLNLKYAETIIGRAKKQLELYGKIENIFEQRKTSLISRKELLDLTGYTASVLNGLIEKKVVEQVSIDVSRIETDILPTREPFTLNRYQQIAFDEINSTFQEKNICLLHGVTSSGKTEIYIHLIEKMLSEGKQTLYLVPEIALTTQLTQRLQAVFGDKLGIYHSKINDNERAEIWQKMLSDNPYEIVIGVRSSLFLPFRHLGLVIVDEEHESSYKQQEPAPRYHARETAIMLAHFFGAKTLLGSATPSMESYFNAKNGKYGLVTLTKRFEEMELPNILLENTFELRRRKKMKSVLSPNLIAHMNEALLQGEQVILFRNRRGFAPLLECKNCGWTPKCRHCDVSLTYHKYGDILKCHYCNSVYKIVTDCPVCEESSVRLLGQGTEKIEEEVELLFPDYRVARMDTDTTRGKQSYEKIISDFQNRKSHILVGTQMLSKGLDFDNVSVVGIISADGMLNYPDFRSHERGFQLMTQAAGRSGRKNKRGTVIIQTSDPEQPIYQFIVNNDFESFYNLQLSERKLFRYPPYFRLIRIVFKDRYEQKAESASIFFANVLKSSLKERVLGPNKPLISKIQRYHIREILLKLETNISANKVRELIKQAESRLRSKQEFKYVVLYFDVDGV